MHFVFQHKAPKYIILLILIHLIQFQWGLAMEQDFLEPPLLLCFTLDQSFSYFLSFKTVIPLYEVQRLGFPTPYKFRSSKKRTSEV